LSFFSNIKNLHIETLQLDEKGKAESKNNFFQLFTIISDCNTIPKSKISVSGSETDLIEEINPTRGFKSKRNKKKELIILQNDWQNIMLYDGYAFFAGCVVKRDFKQKSEPIKRFYKKCKQYKDTLVDNNKILVRDLENINTIL